MKYRFIDEKKQHVHTLDGEPLYGTSTVIKEVMPPFLAKWGAQCAVDFLKENPGEWDKAINAWSKVRKENADTGNELHEALEAYVNECLARDGVPQPYKGLNEQVRDYSMWAVENVDKFLYSEVYVFSKRLWVGGVVDVVLRLKDGRNIIGDFKSNPNVYMNMYFQCAGYDCQQAENGFYTKDGEKLGDPLEIGAYQIYTFGGSFKAHTNVDVSGLREGFEAFIKIYNLLP